MVKWVVLLELGFNQAIWPRHANPWKRTNYKKHYPTKTFLQQSTSEQEKQCGNLKLQTLISATPNLSDKPTKQKNADQVSAQVMDSRAVSEPKNEVEFMEKNKYLPPRIPKRWDAV